MIYAAADCAVRNWAGFCWNWANWPILRTLKFNFDPISCCDPWYQEFNWQIIVNNKTLISTHADHGMEMVDFDMMIKFCFHLSLLWYFPIQHLLCSSQKSANDCLVVKIVEGCACNTSVLYNFPNLFFLLQSQFIFKLYKLHQMWKWNCKLGSGKKQCSQT